MTKHRRSRRRSQKGGDWYNPGSWFKSSTPGYPKKSVFDSITGATSGVVSGANNLLGSAAEGTKSGFSSVVSGASGIFSKDVDLTGSTTTGIPSTTGTIMGGRRHRRGRGRTMGGRRHRRGRTMKGGKGGLGLTYYASPVSGLKVAEPTYWINQNTNTNLTGGTKRSHSKRSHTKRRKSSSRKSRKSRR